MLTLKTHRLPRARAQEGVTLIEALVALVVMSFGMIALVGLMGNLRLGNDIAKQRGEALRLAQSELEKLRSYSLLTGGDATTVTYADSAGALDSIKAKTYTVTPPDSNTAFTVTRQVDPVIADAEDKVEVARSVRVIVTWMDRTGKEGSVVTGGTPQSITLDTLIARVDPAFSGALGVSAPAGGTRQPGERHPAIPVAAKDVGKNRSAFRPSSTGGAVWIFNNVTGVIVGECTVAVNKDLGALTEAEIASCSPTTGYLVSGTVRFSNTSPANPANPEAGSILLDLALTAGTYPTPVIGPDKLPMKDPDTGEVLMQNVPATPPVHTCFNDSSAMQRFVNYNCIVYPDPSSRSWSGKLILIGFNIGTTASDYRVCRYTADYNGNGTQYTKKGSYVIDNYEHPAVYANVMGPLARQNFLVVKGDVDCPTAPAVNPSARIFTDYSTSQQQP